MYSIAEQRVELEEAKSYGCQSISIVPNVK